MGLSYDESEFSELRFNPFATDGKKMIQVYADLSIRHNLTYLPQDELKDESLVVNHEVLDALIRFCVLFGIKDGNPLNRERDLGQKKKKIMQILGINKNHNAYPYIEQRHGWFLLILREILSLVNDRDYSQWLAMREYFEENLSLLMASVLDSDDPAQLQDSKAKAAKAIKEGGDMLNKLESKLFPDSFVKDAMHNLEKYIADGKGGFAEFVVAQSWPY